MTDDAKKSASPPLVSIGLPVFNGERYLREALISLIGQTVQDLEIVVVDNASTDGSLAIAEEIARVDRRLRVLVNSSNIGAAANYNRAFEESRGQYFKWAAHDDVHAPDYVEACLDVLQTQPSVALAYTVSVDIDESGAELYTTKGGAYAGSHDPVERATDILLNPSPCYEAFGLAHRRLLRNTSLIGPYTSSDRVLLLELALQGRFHEVDRPLFRHRNHSASSTSSNPSARDRARWFDPAATRKGFPVARLGYEYRKAVKRSELSSAQRRRLYAVIAKWTLRNRKRLVREAGRSGLMELGDLGRRIRDRSSLELA